jgi:nucleotide-binding universal stress UspA family protein
MENINHILLVTRLIPYCENALQLGISMARNYDAVLYMLRLVDDMHLGAKKWNLSVPMLFSCEACTRKTDANRSELEDIISDRHEYGIKIVPLIRKGGSEAVLQVVKEKEIDLIIMSAHEEGRLEHFLFRGPNEKIIRSLPCSVVLVKKEPAVFGAVY